MILGSSLDKLELRIPEQKFYLRHLKKIDTSGVIIARENNLRILSYYQIYIHQVSYTYKTSEKKKNCPSKIFYKTHKKRVIKRERGFMDVVR